MYRAERREGRREECPSLLPSLLAKGVEMSLTGPACEEGGKERGEEGSWVFPGPLSILRSLLRYMRMSIIWLLHLVSVFRSVQ